MSSFIRYWWASETDASGWASCRSRKREVSRPPFRATAFLTCGEERRAKGKGQTEEL